MRNNINKVSVTELSERILGNYPRFNKELFLDSILPFSPEMGLYERLDLIRDKLYDYLPKEFNEASNILINSSGPELNDNQNDLDRVDLSSANGFIAIASTNYIAKYGLENFETSMNALYEITKRFSSEGAIRYFIEKYPDRCFKLFDKWTDDKNVHVRRLVSEGLRPRLPWAIRLKDFIRDPSPIFPLLDKLKDDKELYVRRSVANNINDIAKDHPQLVIKVLKKWKNPDSKEMEWLIKHALRTLVKQGNSDALDILGYTKNPYIEIEEFKHSSEVSLGDSIDFSFFVKSKSDIEQKLVIDYIIHHKKNNGKQTPKVFKLKNVSIDPKEKIGIKKCHYIKKISTRKYYAGEHKIEIQVNGKRYKSGKFQLHI